MDTRHYRLAAWSKLPSQQIHEVFPDATPIGQMSVDFNSTEMTVYRFKDAAGNDAFAFDRGYGVMSHGSQILSSESLSLLRRVGAEVGGG